MRKVAIVGTAPTTKTFAPFNDPDWEIWGLAWQASEMPRCDRAFEMHQPKDYKKDWGSGAVYDIFRKPDSIPLYMLNKLKEFPGSITYPIAKVAKVFNMGENGVSKQYFCSSFAYMLGMAALEAAEEIAIYGCDLVCTGEWEMQRPNTEWMIGFLQGKGVKTSIASGSALLKANYVYGYETLPDEGPLTTQIFMERLVRHQKIRDEAQMKRYIARGAATECSILINEAPPARTTKDWLELLAARGDTYTNQEADFVQQGATAHGQLLECQHYIDALEHHGRAGVIPTFEA